MDLTLAYSWLSHQEAAADWASPHWGGIWYLRLPWYSFIGHNCTLHKSVYCLLYSCMRAGKQPVISPPQGVCLWMKTDKSVVSPLVSALNLMVERHFCCLYCEVTLFMVLQLYVITEATHSTIRPSAHLQWNKINGNIYLISHLFYFIADVRSVLGKRTMRMYNDRFCYRPHSQVT